MVRKLTKQEMDKKLLKRLGRDLAIVASGAVVTSVLPPIGIGLVVVGSFDGLAKIIQKTIERGHKVKKIERVGKNKFRLHIEPKKKSLRKLKRVM